MFSANAQSGASCATSLTLPKSPPDVGVDESQKQITQWYLFKSENTQIRITLRNRVNATSDKSKKITLWGGSCGTLTMVGNDTLSSPSDSVLVISAPVISDSTVYYLQVDKFTTTDLIKYSIGITYKLVAPTCSSCSIPVTNSCDMICNGSFETYSPTFPPTNSGIVDYMSYSCAWDNACAGGGTPDYFTSLSPTGASSVHVPNNQFGSESAFQGGSYAGFFAQAPPYISTPYWHEYVYQQLRCPLENGVKYRVRFYVSLADRSGKATKSIGAAFVDNLTVALNAGNDGLFLDNTGVIPQVPQILHSGYVTDTTNWTLITGTFTATGTEENMIIGDFGSASITVGAGSNAYYYLDSVSVVPVDSTFTLVSDADSTICNGDSVVMHTQVIDSLHVNYYYWTSIPLDTSLLAQDSMSTITVFPHDTTTYYSTIVVGSCGCTFHDTIQINVVPLPPKPIINGDSIVCTVGDTVPYTIMNFDSTLIYSVTVIPVGAGGIASSVDSLGVFTVIFNDVLGDTLLLTVRDSTGCDSFAVFIIKPCCINGDTTFLNDSATAMILHYGGLPTISNKSFSLNGTFTIDANMIWKADSLKLGTDAVINILSPFTLYITNASQLSACGAMWDKIKIQPGATLKVDKNSIIEDAKTAIYSIAGGRYILDGARLNRNLKHMELTPYSALPHPGTIKDTKLTCQPILGGIATLNPPYTGYRTQIGIDINGVLRVPIGIVGAANTNKFKNMNLGIQSVKSSVTVINNDFSGMDLAVFPNTGIAAIKATGNPIFPYVIRTLTVGDGTVAGTNTFKNCFDGIDVVRNMNVKIDLNDFKLINNKCVFIKNSSHNNSVVVTNNDFASAAVAVHCLSNTFCHTTISINRIVNMKNYSTGIWLQEISSSSVSAIYTAFDNTIKTVEFGIKAENLSRATIDNNKIETKPYVSTFLKSIGIQVLGNYGTRVTSNTVKTVPFTYATKNGGIFASLSPASYIYCNTVKDMGYGIKCAGAMPSDVFNNTMNNDFYGLQLDNFCFIGKQDNPSVAGQASYNKWLNIPVAGFSTTSKRTITTVSTNGSLDTLVFRTGAAAYKPYPTFASVGSILIRFDSTATGPASAPFCPMVISAKLLKRAQDIALENISFPGNDANNKWQSKHALLMNILNDSIDVSTSGVLTAFMTLSATDNLGKLEQLNATITNSAKFNTTDMSIAQGVSSSVSPINDIETNMKLINDIVINNYLANTDYSPSQISDLRALANKCPYTDGVGVYQARVLLSEVDSIGTIYYNACESDEAGRSMTLPNTDVVQDENRVLLIYPNPATNQLTVNYQVEPTDVAVFEIYNLVGERVIFTTLNASANTQVFSVADLNSGVYFYKYSINNQMIKASKLIIVK